ncbi:MAG: type II toxin-antitoxin system PemK/MazF family toxin [Pirellulales bacterium]|nr:type II toxin-antitoxin system PemK/MazF family toxin [Pirellulales bacterium]
MEQYTKGDVVQILTVDPNGLNEKKRPAVVLSDTFELEAEDAFLVVAVSGQFREPLSDDYVLLPWARGGRTKSGLTKPCVAKCRWLVRVTRKDVFDKLGHLPDLVTCDIMRTVNRFRAE